MDKVNSLYIILVLNLIIMIYTGIKILRSEDFTKIKKAILLYVTILFPIIGLLLIIYDRNKQIVT